MSTVARIACLALAVGCSVGDANSPNRPATAVAASDDVAITVAGASRVLRVRVSNSSAAPLHGVVVSWTAVDGGAAVAPASSITAADGEASATWSVGTSPGTRTVRATVAGLPDVHFSTVVSAAAPASLTPLDAPSSATAGSVVVPSPGVVVRDQYGNPVPGASVTFAVGTGGGSLTDSVRITNGEGVARVGSWRIGNLVGPNAIHATVVGGPGLTFNVAGAAGPPSSVQLLAGAGQVVPVLAAVPVRPSVRVTDAYENPVAGLSVIFSSFDGGSVSGAQSVTGDDGVATVGNWSVGAEPGRYTLYVSAGTLPQLELTADAVPSGGFNVMIDGVHLNQGNQSLAGSIGGVSSRAGLLRVVARASSANHYSATVRVSLWQDGAFIRDTLLLRSTPGVPTAPNLELLSDTWNLVLSPGEVVPGLSVVAVIDPDATIPEEARADNRYPRGDGAASLDVRALPPLNIVFFPIHSTRHGRTGSITAANVETFLLSTRQWIPAGTINTTVRAPFTTDIDLSSSTGWSSLLAQLQAVRTLEGAWDEYYHGIVGDFPGIPIGGIAYRPSVPTSTARTGLSYDRLPAAAGTIAHELGHNLGRPHAPCGDPAGPDPAYPHPNAVLGAPGFDLFAGILRSANGHRDYMSYCSPRWSSDYTYGAILQWRRSDPFGRPTASQRAAAPSDTGVLVWGRIGASGVALEPIVSAVGRASLPAASGPNVVRGVDASGRELFRLQFAGVAVEDGLADEQHFSFFIPLGATESLTRVELTTPVGSAARQRPPNGQVRPQVRAEPAAAGLMRITWSAGAHPLVVARDATTGRILSFLRGGDGHLATPAAALEYLAGW